MVGDGDRVVVEEAGPAVTRVSGGADQRRWPRGRRCRAAAGGVG